MNPRIPTKEEKKALIDYLVAAGYGMGTVAEKTVVNKLAAWVDDAAIAIFDDYSTQGTGYTGKVMVVVWTDGVETAEVFVWKTGKLEKVSLRS